MEPPDREAQRRRVRAQASARLPTRTAHCVMVTTNVVQLLLIILFLVLMLMRLDGADDLSWAGVFAPLWISDLITCSTGAHELGRLVRPTAVEPLRRNLLIIQVNRLKGTLCTAIFKVLVVRRLSDPLDQTPARVICIPFYVCAAGRLVLHYLKEKVPSPEHQSPPKRPGTPVNPLHIFVLLIAIRVDGLSELSWAATFWPTWILFGLLAVCIVAATFLGVGILVTGEPRENGQRALFFICYGVLLTVAANGFAFQLNLVRRLDGDDRVSNAAIIGPLVCAYCSVLVFYLAFTFILPRVVESDMVAMSEHLHDEEDQRDGVIDAVSSQLAPPFLVQQSTTLFQRVNAAMLQTFIMPKAAAAGPALPESKEAATAEHLTRSSSATTDADVAAGAAPGEESADGVVHTLAHMEEGEKSSRWTESPIVIIAEFEALQEELGDWLKTHSACSASLRQAVSVTGRAEADAVADGGGVTAPAAALAPDVDARTDAAAPPARVSVPSRVSPSGACDGGSDRDAAGARGNAAAVALAPAAPAAAPAGAAGEPAASGGAVASGFSECRGADPAAAAPSDGREPRAELGRDSSGVPATADVGSPAAELEQHGSPARAAADARSAGGQSHVLHAVPVHVSDTDELPGNTSVVFAQQLDAIPGLPPNRSLGQPHGPLRVPPDVLRKLHRYVELKRQIASRAISATLVELTNLADPPATDEADRSLSAPFKGATPSKQAPLAVGAGASNTRPASADADDGHELPPAGADDQVPDQASPSTDPSELSEVNCWICCEGPRDAVFLECGHGGVCHDCARRCFKKARRLCPMCRQPITQVVHIHVHQVEYNGSRIVKVHDADPAVLTALAESQAPASATMPPGP